MRWFLARRVTASLITLLLASVVIFVGVRALPGGPAVALSAESNDPAVVAAIEHKYHLDQNVVLQYGHWLGLAVQGDLGESPLTKLSVSSVLGDRIPVTLELTLLALLLGLVIGVPAGVLAAVRPGRLTDYLASGVALAGLSIPHFWFGIVLILLLAVNWHVLPSAGYVPMLQDPVSNLLHMAMPAFVLGTGLAAIIMRQTRSAMVESLGADYIRTARAKGVSEWTVVASHALRNSLITVVTVFGLQLGALIGGVVTIEQVFGIPGIGKLTLDSVFQRDYPTLQGVVLLTATAYVVVNLLVDLTYSLINPRIRVTGAAA